jgi:NAD(P)-dependent dehydrogenase (short-subunit alcohol dehydrogenase family)
VQVLQKSNGRLNVLVTNAGAMFAPEGRTAEGFEIQFGTNHLGKCRELSLRRAKADLSAHFYLFHLLKGAMRVAASPEFHSRVISVSSAAHRYGQIDFDDLDAKKKGYDPYLAYGQSKLANIHFANELDRR